MVALAEKPPTYSGCMIKKSDLPPKIIVFLETLFLRKQKRFLFNLDGFMQTETVSNPIFGAN